MTEPRQPCPECEPKHPMQKLYTDCAGTVRFTPNNIVRFLLDHGNHDLNRLAMLHFDERDWEQFAQLIGYSVDGFSELSYASDKAVRKAEKRLARLRQDSEGG